MRGVATRMIFIIGRDWKFRALLRAELLEKGLDAMGLESLEEAGRLVAAGTLPRLTVFDATDYDPSRDLNRLLALGKSGGLLLIVSPSTLLPQELSGATTLSRPIAVGTIVEEILRHLRGALTS